MTSDAVISIVSVLISLYTIVLSIIGTSRTPISEEVLSKQLDKKILSALFISLTVAVLTIIVSALITGNNLGGLINKLLIAINAGLFIYMLAILFALCKNNMDAMAKEIDEENQNSTQLKNEMREIKLLLMQINENLRR